MADPVYERVQLTRLAVRRLELLLFIGGHDDYARKDVRTVLALLPLLSLPNLRTVVRFLYEPFIKETP
jgi:hypothetical protein